MTQISKTVALGLLGLVVAAALGYFALELVSQPVGLNSQPVTAGQDLVPQSSSVDKVPDAKKPKKPKKRSSGSTDDTSSGRGTTVPDDNGGRGKSDDDLGGGDDHGHEGGDGDDDGDDD